jgi:hypothetical protein
VGGEEGGPTSLIGSPSREELGPRRPTPAHWFPIPPPDLGGIPSGLDDLGADAPAQSGKSLRDGIDVRLRGGIQRVAGMKEKVLKERTLFNFDRFNIVWGSGITGRCWCQGCGWQRST